MEKAQGRSHWWVTAVLIVTDVIGGGILALRGTFAALGWVCGLFSLLLLGYVSLYTGQLLGRLHTLYPFLRSYGDLGAEFFGRRGRIGVSALAYLQMFGLCVVFLVGMTIFARQALVALQEPGLCFVTLSAVLSAFTLLFAQGRDLHAVGHLACWIAMPTLYVAVALFLFQLFGDPGVHAEVHVETHLLPPRGASKSMVAFMDIVMTYAGHVVFFELMAAMRQPGDFEKALWASQGIIMLSYFSIAALVYAMVGEDVETPFQLSLAPTLAVGIADLSMLVHVLISLLINHHVVSKALLEAAASFLTRADTGSAPPEPASEGRAELRGRLTWLVATVVVMACAWFVANLVPFFADVMALLSAVGAVNLTYGFPAAAALLQYRREVRQRPLKRVAEEVEEAGSAAEAASNQLASPASVFIYPALEVPCCYVIVAFSAVMMLCGSCSAVLDTMEQWGSSSRLPFGC